MRIKKARFAIMITLVGLLGVLTQIGLFAGGVPSLPPWLGLSHAATHELLPAQRPSFQTGMVFPQWGTTSYSERDTSWHLGLTEIRSQTGSQWVEMVIHLYQPSAQFPVVGTDNTTPTPAAIEDGIRMAHSLHFHVFLVPQITVGQSKTANNVAAWIGSLQYPTLKQTQAWFDSYWNAFKPFAEAAQHAGADQLAIGTEYQLLELAPPELWNQLIARVHAVFPGRLSYDMNFSSLTEPILSWMKNPLLTTIGISEYVPLTMLQQRLDPKALPLLWKTIVQHALDDFSTRLGKHIILSELGYRDTADALYRPWLWQSTFPPDDEEQAGAYDAALQNALSDPHVDGVFIWAWSIPVYETNWKPAAKIIDKWYTSSLVAPYYKNE